MAVGWHNVDPNPTEWFPRKLFGDLKAVERVVDKLHLRANYQGCLGEEGDWNATFPKECKDWLNLYRSENALTKLATVMFDGL